MSSSSHGAGRMRVQHTACRTPAGAASAQGTPRRVGALEGQGWSACTPRRVRGQTERRGTRPRREAADFVRDAEGGGATCVLLAAGPRLMAAFAVADPVRPEAAGVVAALHARGVAVHLLTGAPPRRPRPAAPPSWVCGTAVRNARSAQAGRRQLEDGPDCGRAPGHPPRLGGGTARWQGRPGARPPHLELSMLSLLAQSA